ncbi:hypothetical protein FJ977_23545 [Mesorhizobium sp. B2-1-3A]|nr:hypothetical protein FJ977_23545 [Mesorhizobium sp. B2-1-3A]
MAKLRKAGLVNARRDS